ncbi:MAG: TrkH family potassium uptake protein [Bacteroidales bacterium]|nr:TrkH family potassium uptake protein [Bacteroidales bacterium]MBQ6101302.1 TrkH family potassium uptake protein [Bacteroidales bacterium]
MSASSKISLAVLLRVQGFLLIIEGVFMLLVLPVSYFHHGINAFSMPIAALITAMTGFVLCFSTRKKRGQRINHREGVITICLSWLVLSVFGGLPFLLSKSVPNFTDAFFEALSGFTTTGATILTNIEAVPKDILLWRSMTQWIGGLAIIVFAVALIPFLSVGGMQLFMTEMNGINYDKLHPRIMHTAKRLWGLYIFFTLLETLLLYWGDMDWFDALCHSLTTISSGGFSTRTSSIASYSNYSQIVVTFFMILSGCNFTLLLITLVRNPMALFKNEEFQHFIIMIVGISALLATALYFMEDMNVGGALRSAFFSVASVLTTTGFAVSDYTLWPVGLWVVLLLLMFVGACSGSTSGGIKIIRHLIFTKNAFLELKRILHPNAVIPVKINGKSVSKSVIYKTMTFVFVYFFIFVLGTLILLSLGIDFNTSVGASVATLSNLGTGVGEVGPFGTYAFLPQVAKWVLAIFMLLGRVELFTLIAIFSRNFWK